ncbi:isochorismatase family protein [Arthrobacter sp. BB-1]|uniref:isochorismatase family protein n=1 Tax=unclassified Arthrobacter TaxID=235627 RepID=UPI0010E59667|nr:MULTISPECIES: isochorismatase family protein [unclassified Arthrobacter]TNB67227.1 isochorismatase family protein [Arthrobacter sp. BB-1]VII98709.1 N-carbamoylsarcosine amidase (EC 3.5.1.59) [Arthrobacter sp. DR-2P]
MKLEEGDAWVNKGYGQAKIAPGSRPAVLIVDLQYAFTDPSFTAGGSPLIDRATNNAARIAAEARRLHIPVFHTVVAWDNEIERGLWPIKLPYTREMTTGSRWSTPDERVWAEGDVMLPKLWPSFFNGTPLHSLLTAEGIDTVIVTGCTTSGCVRATSVDAFSYGFRTLVPEDAVGDHGQDAHESNLRDIHRRYVEVTSSDQVLAYFGTLPAREPRKPVDEVNAQMQSEHASRV